MGRNEKNDPRLIKKFAGSKILCSILAPDPETDFDCVILEFVEFDPQTYKKKDEIDIYLDLGYFLGLCHMVIDRTVLEGIKSDQNQMKMTGKTFSDAKLFFRRGGGVVNGVIRYREFYIQASSHSHTSVLLVAEECDGYKDSKGLINPKKGANSKKVKRIPVDYMELYNTACLSISRINAFFVAKQLRGAYERRERVLEVKEVEIPGSSSESKYDASEMPQSGIEDSSTFWNKDTAYYGVNNIQSNTSDSNM